MKVRNRLHLLPLLVITISLSVTNLPDNAQAATNQYWNVAGSGGDGIWGTSPGDKNWNTTAGALSGNTFWPDTVDDVAVFQDAVGGTVTVFDAVQTAGIIQNGADYTINAGSITLVQDTAATNPFIDVQSGTLTVDSVLAGTSGMIKNGNGNLVLSNANTYAGNTTLTAGTLTLTGSLESTSVGISAGARLLDQSGGLGIGTHVINAGALTVNSAETVQTYTQDNGGILNGTAALSVNGSATLNGGNVFSSLLGNTTSTGNVLVSGSIGGGFLHVMGGTLSLTGTSTNTALDISSGATLVDVNGGLSDSTVLTNAGTLMINADDSISSYIQNGDGVLAGTAALSTTGGATLNGGTVLGSLLGNATSTGDVLVSGHIGSGSLSVTGGTLILTGTSTNALLGISSGATLLDSNGGLSDSTVLTNAGTLMINADDSISSYIQNGDGVLAGTAALSTTGGATLNGGTVSGSLLGDTTSTGAVLVSGHIGGGSLSVTAGTLTLTGHSTNATVDVSAGASLVDSGNLDDLAAVSNSGTLAILSNDTIGSLTNLAGNVVGGADLTVSGVTQFNGGTLGPLVTIHGDGGGNFNDAIIAGKFNGTTWLHDSSVTGIINGNTTSTGAVTLSGAVGGGSLAVADGTLLLSGISTSATVAISAGASLVDSSGGLDGATILTNAGNLIVNANEGVSRYISNGGTLSAGSGSLGTTLANLNEGSSVVGFLSAETLTSNGAVSISGTTTAKNIHIASGTLTNTGALGAAFTYLNIASGAALVASGSQSYALLTTSGNGVGTWQGNLRNSAAVSPGARDAVGTLAVIGNYTQTNSGVLELDVSRNQHDLLNVTGTARFGGTLELNKIGAADIAPFVPIHLVDAAAYEGNITTLSENLEGAVWFNPGNGDATLIAPPHGDGNKLYGATENQTSTWVALYDDVIEPGTTNITKSSAHKSEYHITSGIADTDNPDLMWALSASFTPSGLNAALLNRLSPEVYTGFSDYAVQATRTHQRTALSAPSLAPQVKADSKDAIHSDAKSPISIAPSLRDWEFFAATDYFNAQTDNSHNQANYQLEGMGLITGLRTHVRPNVQLAAYFAADTGKVDGPLIDADATGWSTGLVSETLLDEKSSTLLTAAISYGRYGFDGSRESVSATSAGWAPGNVHYSDVNSDALELFIGIESTAYQNERFRLVPSVGFRYASGTVEDFNESTKSASGSPIALKIERNNQDALIAEMAMLAEAKLTEKLTATGQLGFNAGIGDDPHVLNATFAKGNRSMKIAADGLDSDLIFLGLGADYQISDTISVGLGFRSEFRSSEPVQQGFNISSAFRF